MLKLSQRDREALTDAVAGVSAKDRMAARMRLQLDLIQARLYGRERVPTSAREWLRGRRSR
jgi:hypothetical protein